MVAAYLTGSILCLFAVALDGARSRRGLFLVACWPVALAVGFALVVKEDMK